MNYLVKTIDPGRVERYLKQIISCKHNPDVMAWLANACLKYVQNTINGKEIQDFQNIPFDESIIDCSQKQLVEDNNEESKQ